ncbi:MAG TPA: DNA-directed RNA polymerase subunit beta' [Candidatus Babeliales bacterium]|nr:DNA-directed RNA polymerase subunit beta' [Candidatus Babeliales bacterium]
MNNRMLDRFREYLHITQFNSIRISLASSKKIRSLSYGEVKKIETINYRTLKPEKDGLFCARIFGPVKDWECNCGKYKRMKHRGVTCEKCGVEVIQSRVRRERMGHIELVAPVCHIWYLKGIPSYLGLILDMSAKDLERVIYFDAYIVVDQGSSPYPRKTLLSNTEYSNYVDTHLDDSSFSAGIGAEVIKILLDQIDIKLEIFNLEKEYSKTQSVGVRHKIMRRLKVFAGLLQANLKPSWMILDVLPVLPPDLRPLVPLEGGRFASSDLNELYRRVLNRNIRLQRLYEIEAPSVIVKNEKRMLQESVDALIDNGRRGQPVRGSNRRPLKSLSEMLRGKQGRFRQNLLGRRVDYSGRSVIVVDPELNMDYCGIPKVMALEIFKSYVYAGLLERELASNLRVAKRMVEELAPEIWDVLEDVVKDRPVLLNRAPTLHRLGIQAFYPILVDGKAIKVHPLVCSAFNADFDGDTMSVHLPLSGRAQEECRRLVLSTNNILSASNGRPVTVPSQDMVLGLHYMTKSRIGALGEGITFSSINEVVSAYQCKMIHIHARINLRLSDRSIVKTTAGRVLLYTVLPEGAEFDWTNKVMKVSDLGWLVNKVYYTFGSRKTVTFLDGIKRLGFYHSTIAGISISLRDLLVPHKKDEIVRTAEKDVEKTESLYMDGAITNGERYNKILSIWGHATADVAAEMTRELEEQNEQAFENKDKSFAPYNPVFMMLDSGARGSKDQIKQLVGMRGMMSKPNGEIMETPVKSNFKDGLSVFEYFISTHGARKGQADTALKTANSGYLTRRLVDVAQDVVVTMSDCKTLGYIEVEDLKEAGDIIVPFSNRVFGRVFAADVNDPVSGELLFKAGEFITRKEVDRLADSAVAKVVVRSVLTCQAKRGVCAICFGCDLSTGKIVDIGTTVGVIAAQSIGEPGTQLTMKTFHVGGIASGLTEKPYFVAKKDGVIQFRGVRTIKNRHGEIIVLSRKAFVIIISPDGRELQNHYVEYGSVLHVEEGQAVQVGTKLVEWDPSSKVVLTEKAGKIEYVDLVENITVQDRFDDTTGKSNRILLEHKNEKYQPALSVLNKAGDEEAHYYLSIGSYLNVENGQMVEPGDVLIKTPREVSKSKDITGGLPRIAELFEARMPKNPAILADISGEVVFGGLHRGLRKISVVAGANTFDYFVARGQQLNVLNGDQVVAGDQLTVGSPVLHDMLRIQGPNLAQRYIVDQIQKIYRLQGIDINDKHIELIARQMFRKVRIIDSGDTDFLIGDRVDRVHFKMVNALLKAEGKKVATAKPVLMGITQASLGTESYISAASFQETTRILAEAAMVGNVDHLYGLKENVIVGKLIPAGTGIESFRKKYLGNDISKIERQARKEEMLEVNDRDEDDEDDDL